MDICAITSTSPTWIVDDKNDNITYVNDVDSKLKKIQERKNKGEIIHVIVSFDIETVTNATIEIGSTLVGPDRDTIAKISASAYYPEIDKMDGYNKKFWNRHEKIIGAIRENTPKNLTPDQGRSKMITGFVDFLIWSETILTNRGLNFKLVTDNKSVDTYRINKLIEKYLLKQRLLPHSMVNGKYLTFIDSRDFQWGILCRDFPIEQLESRFKRNIMEKYYAIPKNESITYTHRAVEDACYIAKEMLDAYDIINGNIKPKT